MKPINFILFIFIRCYQLVISPWLPPSCRYEPTCSKYALEAIERHGPLKGLLLAISRILRCNPFGSYGYDPVPDQLPTGWDIYNSFHNRKTHNKNSPK